MGKTIPILTDEARLKRAVRRHLRSLGFSSIGGKLIYEDSHTKERIRRFHAAQRTAKLLANRSLLKRWDQLKIHFANGSEVRATDIKPRLELIEDSDSWQSKLFAFASLYWSVPTSNGYGRRMRFLCWDDSNEKLLGIVALGDPVFNLRVRDDHIGWTGSDRTMRLSSVMDAYVLGAIPPYGDLLCGKLLACILKSTDLFDVFHKKYYNYKSIISGKRHRAKLALITTSSSLGRSSVYNRLRLGEQTFFRSVGMTRGFGHFHIPERLFVELRDYIGKSGHKYANGHGYGSGANWRMRVIRQAFSELGLSPQILRHGIAREVFLCETASNSSEYLKGNARDLDISQLKSAAAIADEALQRWVIPRALRRPEFVQWDREYLLDAIQKTRLAASHRIVDATHRLQGSKLRSVNMS